MMKLWNTKAKVLTDHVLNGTCKKGKVYEVVSPGAEAKVVWCSSCKMAMAYVGEEIVSNGSLTMPYAFIHDAIFNTGPGTDKARANEVFRELLQTVAANDPENEEEA